MGNYVTSANGQGPVGPIGGSVSALASLASLPAGGATVAAGSIYAYTPTAGGQSSYYQWAPSSTATPDGVHVVAGNGGNWLLVQTGSLSVTARTGLTALADVLLADGAPVFNSESGYQADWVLRKTSTLTVDNLTVVATASGVGRFVLKSRLAGRVPVTECGAKGDGSTDDSTALQNAETATATAGGDVLLPAASPTYVIGQALNIPSGARLRLSPATTLHSTITPVGGTSPNGTPLIALGTHSGNTGTLNATPALGATSVSVNMTSAPSVGQFFFVTHGNSSQAFDIASVTPTGGGNYTVGFGPGQMIRAPFVATDAVNTFTAIPQDITIDGDGGLLSGTGDLRCEIQATRRGTIRRLRIDTSLGDVRANAYNCSFDIGGQGNLYDRVEVTGNGTTSGVTALIMEANQDGRTLACRTTNMTAVGQGLVDCIDCSIEDGVATGCQTGFTIGTDSGLGSYDCTTRGNVARACSSQGFAFATSQGTRSVDDTAISCPYGFNLQAGCVDPVLINPTTYSSSLAGIQVGVSASIRGARCYEYAGNTGTNSGIVVASGVPRVTIEQSLIQTGGAAFSGSGIDTTGNVTSISDTTVQIQTASRIGIIVRAGVTYLRNVRVETSQVSTYGLYCAGSSGTVYIDRQCDFSQAATPVQPAAGVTLVVEQSGLLTLSGSAALTFSQLQNSAIECSAGGSTVTASIAIPGMEWTCKNSGLSASTFFGISIANGKNAKVRINSSGAGERVTADT